MNRRLAHLIGADIIAQSNKELENGIVESNERFCKTLKDISDAEIKSKNRVDITLKEYDDMRDKIKQLSYEVDRLSNILRRIEIPFDKEIIPDSIQTYYNRDEINLKTLFRVEFEVYEPHFTRQMW